MKILKEDKIKMKEFYNKGIPNYGIIHDNGLYHYIVYNAGLCDRALSRYKNLGFKILDLTKEEKKK